MINKDDVKNLIANYLIKRGEQINYLLIDYCLNQVEAGFGKRALRNRLEIPIKNINFNNWGQFYNDLKKALYND